MIYENYSFKVASMNELPRAKLMAIMEKQKKESLQLQGVINAPGSHMPSGYRLLKNAILVDSFACPFFDFLNCSVVY